MEEGAYIAVTSRLKAEYIIILQENSFDGEVEKRRKGIFSSHGLGLEIVKSIVDEYDGQLATDYDMGKKKFFTRVFIKNTVPAYEKH